MTSSHPPSSPGAIREFSAGGVVYREGDGGFDIVVVNRARHTDWSLPKGHIEQGETRQQAAVREVKEETGLDARIVDDLGEIIYFFRRPRGQLVRKSVYHYLLEATTEQLGGPNWEVSEVRWTPIDQADDLLTYENDRNIVAQARRMLGDKK